MRDRFWSLCLLTALVGAGSAAAEDPYWTVELGLLPGHHNNFFFRGPETVAPSSDLLTAYVEAEHEREVGKGDLTLLFAGIFDFVRDIPDADYRTFSTGVEYKRGPTKFSFELERMINRLFSEQGDASFFDQDSFDFWVRRSFGRRVWLRARVQLEEQDFDPVDNDRDADVTKLYGTLRVGLSDTFALRGSLLFEERDARGPENSRTGTGWSLAVEAQPSPRTNLFIRFRERQRDYEDAPPGERNFGRMDTVTDVTLNLRLQVTDSWGVQLRDSYREGESTRPDRNFDGNSVSVGIFYVFGGEES